MSAEDATTQCVPAVLKTARILDLVALGQRTEPGAPFLIRGEPGVGKDVLARLIHAASERQRYSFINVVEVRIPPLRQRTEEIPDFASFFLEQFNRRYRRHVQLCPDVLAAFSAHSWPRNVRELEEAVHRLVVGGAMAPAH